MSVNYIFLALAVAIAGVAVYMLFLHELVSELISKLICRKKKSCQNRDCIFLMHCSKYSARKKELGKRMELLE